MRNYRSQHGDGGPRAGFSPILRAGANAASYSRSPHLGIGWLPDYQIMYEKEVSVDELLAWIRQYPIAQWLGMLGRIQTAIAGTRSGDSRWIRALMEGIVPQEEQKRMVQIARGNASDGLHGLFHERQVATLQQLVLRVGRHEGQGTFASDHDFRVLLKALLAVHTLMQSSTTPDDDSILESMVLDLYRSRVVPVELLALRAFSLWQLSEAQPSSCRQSLFDLFQQATGLHAADFIVGGLAYFISEFAKDPEVLKSGLTLYPPPIQYDNMFEQICRQAYLTLRSRTVDEIKAATLIVDRSEDLATWNLVAMHQAPVIRISKEGYLLNNLSSVASSIQDGIRHELRSAALGNRLAENWNGTDGLKRVEGEYGTLFEEYVLKELNELCPGLVHRPESPADGEKIADAVIWNGKVVAVIEIKSWLFRAVEHFHLMTLADRQKEIRGRISEGLIQIENTIRLLRDGKQPIPGLISPDWTAIPIVPVLITEERIPTMPLIWEKVLLPIIPSSLVNKGGLPTAPIRFLNITDIESSSDYIGNRSWASDIYHWASDPNYNNHPWTSWARSRSMPTSLDRLHLRFEGMKQAVAKHLNLLKD